MSPDLSRYGDPELQQLIEADELLCDERDRQDRIKEMAGADEYRELCEFVDPEQRRRYVESGAFGG